MAKYSKKIQVLVTEQQYKDLEEIARKQKKKPSFLVREAVEEYHLKKKKEIISPDSHFDLILRIKEIDPSSFFAEFLIIC